MKKKKNSFSFFLKFKNKKTRFILKKIFLNKNRISLTLKKLKIKKKLTLT
jgi:hypothetical protein